MTNKKAVSKAIFIGILFLLVYWAPFIHNNFLKLTEWRDFASHYKKHKVIINTSNTDRSILIANFEKDIITKNTFLTLLKKLEQTKKQDLKTYFTKKKKLQKEYSFMGYQSFRSFLIHVGYNIFGLFATILLLIFILNPNHLKEFRQFYKVAVIGLLYVSSYWFLHAILTKTDFSQWTYSMSFVALSIVAVVLIFLFTYLLSQKETKLKKGIQLLISYISIDLYSKSKNKKEALIKDLNKYEELKNIIE